MENLNQLERELESFLPGDADLEPNIVESDYEDYEDQSTILEDYGMGEEEDDFVDSVIEMIDSEDFDESYDEGGRREKANRKRSLQNRNRGLANSRNIVRINRDIGKVKKKTYRNSKSLRSYTKRARINEIRNKRVHRKLSIDVRRTKRAVRMVGNRTVNNAKAIELMGLMAIPKAVGNGVSPFGVSDGAKALPGILAELASLLAANTKMNKWALIAIASAVVAASPFVADKLAPNLNTSLSNQNVASATGKKS